MAKFIPILKLGRYKDASGRNCDITPQILKDLTESYKVKSAPLVKGHPNNDAPAMGWIERLKIVGDELQASFCDITDEFRQEVEQGSFKNISASFFYPLSESNPVKGKYTLRHVGALGANRPAIPNLGTLKDALAFSEDEEGVSCIAEFSEEEENIGFFEKIIKKAIDKALKKQREEIIAEVKQSFQSLNFSEGQLSSQNNKNNGGTENMSDLTKSTRELELEQELKKSQDEIARMKAEVEKGEISSKVKAEVSKVAKEKNLDEKTTKSLEEKATKLAETGIKPEEVVASLSEFIPDNSKQSTSHRFGNKIPTGEKGSADFSEGDDQDIENTAEFADEVMKLEKDGISRAEAFKQAKINLSKK